MKRAWIAALAMSLQLPLSAAPPLPTNTSSFTDDARSNFEATAYAGVVVDNFAAPEAAALAYPGTSTGIKSSYLAGIDFAYRLSGNPSAARPWKGSQLWIYGETVHGQRSADVDCGPLVGAPICPLLGGLPPAAPAAAFLSVLRNATSLEAYAGLRLEFLALQPHSADAARLYVKSELGFLTVSGSGRGAIDSRQRIALGAIATNGKFQHSYLEAGYGRTDLFLNHPARRFKMDGYLTWDLNQWMKDRGVTPFLEMTVDSDFGPGSDSVRTYYGFNFDLEKILIPGSN